MTDLVDEWPQKVPIRLQGGAHRALRVISAPVSTCPAGSDEQRHGGRVPARTRTGGEAQTADEAVLPAQPETPGKARRFVVETLDRAGHTEHSDVVELLTSELVTNAVVHAGTGVRLRAVCVADRVRVEVSDRSAVLPMQRQPVPEAMSGRGLVLVSSLADRWGVDPSPSGKTVWFELAM